MMVYFVLSFFPRDVLDEILNLNESVSEGFPTYSSPNIYPRAKETRKCVTFKLIKNKIC